MDLPGHGANKNIFSHYSLDNYVDAVVDIIAKNNQPVTLIGHSFGGVVISQVVEKIPKLIDKLIYVCAFLLPNGYNTADIINESKYISPLIDHITKDETARVMRVSDETARQFFYNQCPDNLIAYAMPLLCDEPLSPTEQKTNLTEKKFGEINKFYIKTLGDKAILPALQNEMIQKNKVTKVFEINADHSPFFSAIPELNQILTNIILDKYN